MRRFDVVSFDFDGTLIFPNFTDHFWNETIPRLYADTYRLRLKEAKARVLREYEIIGKDDLRWYLPSYWFDRFGLNVSVVDALQGIKNLVKIYPEVPTVLERLGADHTLIATSRASREFIDLWSELLGNRFSYTFSSTSDFGLVEKTTDFYKRICDAMDVSPNRVAHVGDDYQSDFVFPREAGITALLLKRTGDANDSHVVRDLKEFEQKLRACEEG